MAEHYDPPEVWVPFGAFSQVAVVGTGRTVFLKGQVALDRAGLVVGEGDMRAQVRQTLLNIQAVLAHVGGRVADIVALTHHVTDIAAFTGTGDIRREFFAPPYPVTTTVQVVALYRPELLVEITAVAEVPRDRLRRPEPRPAG